MTKQAILKEIRRKVAKLAAMAQALRGGSETYFSITRLTSLKSLCQEHEIANRFVFYLAERTREKINTDSRPRYISEADWTQYKRLIAEAIAGLRNYLEAPTAEHLSALRDILFRIAAEQNECRKQGWNTVRLIYSTDLLVVEYALRCVIYADMAPYWAYQTARQYAERYDAHYGTGLIPASAPMLEDIVQFWHNFVI
jgi:hypothetical protein